jgi:beta-glucanase (GH16 family)
MLLQDMKRMLFVTFVLASTGSARAEPPAGYLLAWSDEFNGSALDAAKWNYRTGAKGWSQQLPHNVAVANGFLQLALKKEERGDWHYTGGGVISKPAFNYGYYEARVRVPPGAGWHTSFWLQPNGAGPEVGRVQEIDIAENDSINPTAYHVNVYRKRPKPVISYEHKAVKTPNLAAGFHVWGCEFTPTKIKFFFDDKEVDAFDATEVPHADQNIWLTSIAAALGKTTAVDDAKLPAAAQFDWVRFYTKSGD